MYGLALVACATSTLSSISFSFTLAGRINRMRAAKIWWGDMHAMTYPPSKGGSSGRRTQARLWSMINGERRGSLSRWGRVLATRPRHKGGTRQQGRMMPYCGSMINDMLMSWIRFKMCTRTRARRWRLSKRIIQPSLPINGPETIRIRSPSWTPRDGFSGASVMDSI